MTKAKTIYAVMKNSVNIAWFYFSLKYNKKNIMMKVLRLMLYFLQAFSEVDNGNKHKQHQWNRNTTSVELAQKILQFVAMCYQIEYDDPKQYLGRVKRKTHKTQ